MQKRALFVLACLVLAAFLSGCGEEERPTSVSSVLDNGLTLVVRENHSSGVVAIQAWVIDGALYEEADEAGIANLLAQTLFEETASYGPGGIRAELESAGGTIAAYSSHDFTLVSLVVDARHFERALDMMRSSLTEPVFSNARLTETKARFPLMSSSGARGPIEEAYRLCSARMLPEHPYGRASEGTVSSIAGIGAAELAEHHRAMYVPGNMVIVVVGAVDAQTAADTVAEAFASLEPAEAPGPLSGPPEWPTEPVRVVETASVEKSFAALAFPGPGIDDPENVAMDVLTGVLWRGETAGLHRLLVNELGLATSVSVGWYTRRQPSPVFIWVELQPGALDSAESAILGAVSKLAADGVPQQEVDEVIEAIRSSMLFAQETVEGQAHNIGYWTSIGEIGFETEYMEKLEHVTAEDVRRLAERHLRARSRALAAIVPEDAE